MSARTRLAAGTLMLAGLGLIAAPMAAHAHTGNLFTYSGSDTEDNLAFASVSPVNAALTQLATKYDYESGIYVVGAEICDEKGWGVSDSVEAGVVFEWNHDTGEIGPLTELTADVADFEGAVSVDVTDVWAADSLSDCASLAYVYYTVVDENADVTYLITVAWIDRATGETEPIAFLYEDDGGESQVYWQGLATDLVSGITYVFVEYLNNPYYATIDLATGDVSDLVLMGGLVDQFDSTGFPLAADYQPDGVLWLTYGVNQLEEYHLLSFAAGADLAAAGATDHGALTYTQQLYFDGYNTLAYDPAGPRLPDTGSSVPAVAIAASGILLLAAGAAVAFSSRARRAN